MTEPVRRLNFETPESSLLGKERSPLGSMTASSVTRDDVENLVSSFERGEMKKSPFRGSAKEEEECVGDFCTLKAPTKTGLFHRERMTVDPGMTGRFRAEESRAQLRREEKKTCDTSEYWVGPYGVKVPNEVTSVVAADGRNTLYKDGKQTEIYVKNPLTREEYLKRYSFYSDECGYVYNRPGAYRYNERNEAETEALFKAEQAKATIEEEESELTRGKKIGLEDLRTLMRAGEAKSSLREQERATLRNPTRVNIETLAREAEATLKESRKDKPVEERLKRTAERVERVERAERTERAERAGRSRIPEMPVLTEPLFTRERLGTLPPVAMTEEREYYRNRSPPSRGETRATLSRLKEELAEEDREEEEAEARVDLTRARISRRSRERSPEERSQRTERVSLKSLQEEREGGEDYLTKLLSKIPPVQPTERYSVASLRDRIREQHLKGDEDEDVDDKIPMAPRRSPDRSSLGLTEREIQEARDLELARELQEEENRASSSSRVSRVGREEPKYSLKDLRREAAMASVESSERRAQLRGDEREFEEFTLLDRDRTNLRAERAERRAERSRIPEMPVLTELPTVSGTLGRLPPLPVSEPFAATLRVQESMKEKKSVAPALILTKYLGDLETDTLRWTFSPKPVPQMPNAEYIRVGAIGDGNCFFHAVCKGLADKYRQSYSVPDIVTEAYLQDLESYIGGVELFDTRTFQPIENQTMVIAERTEPILSRSRANPLTTQYRVNRSTLNNEMGRYRRAFVRQLREDMATNVIEKERYQTIVANNTTGRIGLKLEEIVLNLGLNIENLSLSNTLQDVIRREGLSYEDLYTAAIQNVLNEIVIDLRNMNSVEPFYTNILSDVIDADIYLLRDQDLMKPPGSKDTPFYSGVSFHQSIRGPSNLKTPDDYYYGLPDRRAIVIISYGDNHYELIGRQDQKDGAFVINTTFSQNEPLIQDLYRMLSDLRKRAV